MLNSYDGWFLTADHIVEGWAKVSAETSDNTVFEQKVAEINARADLKPVEKQRAVRALVHPKAGSARAAVLWWGFLGYTVEALHRYTPVDLAIGKLANFDPATVPVYPTLQPSLGDMGQGASVCRLGYAFIQVPVQFDRTKNSFDVGKNGIVTPCFASEGMVSRYTPVPLEQGVALDYPAVLIETSSPGLKGQSGGALFDSSGLIWGIQSKTAQYSLGFEVEGEKQFLNVGWAVSTATIIPLLERLKVSFAKAEN